jgi:hypothetical protein
MGELMPTEPATEPTWPATPGSTVRATACDGSRPSVYMRLATDEDEIETWVRPDLVTEPYRQSDLALIEVIHDEGRR